MCISHYSHTGITVNKQTIYRLMIDIRPVNRSKLDHSQRLIHRPMQHHHCVHTIPIHQAVSQFLCVVFFLICFPSSRVQRCFSFFREKNDFSEETKNENSSNLIQNHKIITCDYCVLQCHNDKHIYDDDLIQRKCMCLG